MQSSTEKILEAALKADLTIGTAERNRILKLARNGDAAAPVESSNGHAPRIYSREQAAEIIGGRTTRFIDQLCRRGLLKKFTPKGNQRAIGICGESLHQFIQGA
jgi:hypothetical protein